jgi:hypothetical protein
MSLATLVTHPLLRLLLLLARAGASLARWTAAAAVAVYRLATGRLYAAHQAGPERKGAGSRPPPPTTLALVLADTGPQALHVVKLGRVINWCADAGLRHLYLYDPAGVIKQAALDVYSEACHGAGASAQRAYVVKLGWGEEAISQPPPEERAIVVLRVLSAEDSRAPVVAAVRSSWAERPSGGGAAVGEAGRQPAAGHGAPGGTEAAGKLGPEGAPDAAAAGAAAGAQRAPVRSAASPDARQQDQRQRREQQQQEQQRPQHERRPAAPLSFEQLAASVAQAAGPDVLHEPQLVLVFGPMLSLAGYPPLHTKTAEIYHAGWLAGASQAGLLRCIGRYCKTNQRFGT